MKYYLITTYNCFGGEHFYYYVALPEGESPYDEKWVKLFYEWVCDDAAEWWNNQFEGEYDGDYDAYLSECGYSIKEISKEECLRDCEKS